MTTAPKPRRRRWILLGLLAIVAGVVVYAAVPGKNTYTVGPETTYVTDPIDTDGRVDYVTALNTRLRGDITPEQNANVFIWQAIGPHPENSTLPDEYFQWLGRPAPPEGGEYLVSWWRFRRPNGEPIAEGSPEAAENAFQDARGVRARAWPWTAAAEPDLAAWLKRNERPLALLSQAATRPAYFNPLVPPRPPTGDGRLTNYIMSNVHVGGREGGGQLVSRAMMKLGDGRPTEAWQDLLACHRLGLLYTRGGSVIEFLVGVAIRQMAAQGTAVFLTHAKLSAAEWASCLADLRALPAPAPVADAVDRAERFVTLDMIRWLALCGPDGLESELGHGPKGPPSFTDRLFTRSTDWDPAMVIVNDWYNRTAAALRREDVSDRLEATAALERQLKADSNRVKDEEIGLVALQRPSRRGEIYGMVALRIMHPAVDLLARAEAVAVQRHRNLITAFALAAFRANHGRYPATLANLAPQYLPDAPNDVFTNGDLIYRPTAAGYILYSVGPNLADDEGRGRQDDPKGDDLAVEMPAKEPPPVKMPEPELE